MYFGVSFGDQRGFGILYGAQEIATLGSISHQKITTQRVELIRVRHDKILNP